MVKNVAKPFNKRLFDFHVDVGEISIKLHKTNHVQLITFIFTDNFRFNRWSKACLQQIVRVVEASGTILVEFHHHGDAVERKSSDFYKHVVFTKFTCTIYIHLLIKSQVFNSTNN